MSGYKLYNGCPNTALKQLWEEEARLLALLNKEEASIFAKIGLHAAEVHCTYHPGQGLYHVHVWGCSLSDFLPTRIEALKDALSKLV